MVTDKAELKPYRSWYQAWLSLECWPMFGLVLFSACSGRLYAQSTLQWPNGRDFHAVQPWIAISGTALALILIGLVYQARRQSSRIVDDKKRSSLSASTTALLIILSLIGMWGLLSVQFWNWYRTGWVPAFRSSVHSELDYRYFKSIDRRLVDVAAGIREGKLAPQGEVESLRARATAEEKEGHTESPRQVVFELRDLFLDWGEESYAMATTAAERRASLGITAMLIDPNPNKMAEYLRWKAAEESGIETKLRSLEQEAANLKQEHESIAVQWTAEQDSVKKSELANQVVAAEDRLNSTLKQQQRWQGRLDLLANERLDQLGLNRLYPWLSLPTTVRGGSWRVNAVWLLAVYLWLRLLVTTFLAVAEWLKHCSGNKSVQSDPFSGECCQPARHFGWFVIAVAIGWIGLGW
jgi:hypothetical protein